MLNPLFIPLFVASSAEFKDLSAALLPMEAAGALALAGGAEKKEFAGAFIALFIAAIGAFIALPIVFIAELTGFTILFCIKAFAVLVLISNDST
jgi:hypothetical protein